MFWWYTLLWRSIVEGWGARLERPSQFKTEKPWEIDRGGEGGGGGAGGGGGGGGRGGGGGVAETAETPWFVPWLVTYFHASARICCTNCSHEWQSQFYLPVYWLILSIQTGIRINSGPGTSQSFPRAVAQYHKAPGRFCHAFNQTYWLALNVTVT